MKKLLILNIVILLAGNTLIAQSNKNKIVSWKESKYASGYQIQVKNSADKLIIDKKTDSNYLQIDQIPEGKYKIRTSALSPFGKPVVWTEWQDLKIELSLPPIVKEESLADNDSKNKTIEQKPNQKLEIEGDNFNDATETIIESSLSKSKIKILDKKIESKNKIELRVDAENAAPGKYDLSLQNPFHPKKTIKNYLEIENKADKVSTQSNTKDSINKIYTMSMRELDEFIGSNSNCYQSELSSDLIKECKEDYVTINLSTREKKDIYYYFLIKEPNRMTRIQSYHHFQTYCSPAMKAIREKVEFNSAKKQYTIDTKEKMEIDKMFVNLQSCPTPKEKLAK
ncbi:MAG: hypothetical protein O9346_11490 [Leptospiraceae bacterium]|nr:hypothetical protein [Leptospiraceae bacterium]MCZ8347032.1 hypothetical protein [Leptospiraceae bacterium]PJE00413.1 MAG: hypothetical protein CK427_14070 [Leptospira sp.]